MVRAVLTGDLVASTRMEEAFLEDWPWPIERVRGLFLDRGVEELFRWELYRGDGFQVYLQDPVHAMRVAIAIRAAIRSWPRERKRVEKIPDGRISIGLGDTGPAAETLSSSRGEAFERSGRGLDGMKKKEERLKLSSPWQRMDEEFGVSDHLADAIIGNWSPYAAEAFLLKTMIEGSNKEIANELGISPSALSLRLKHAHSSAILRFLERYERCVGELI